MHTCISRNWIDQSCLALEPPLFYHPPLLERMPTNKPSNHWLRFIGPSCSFQPAAGTNKECQTIGELDEPISPYDFAYPLIGRNVRRAKFWRSRVSCTISYMGIGHSLGCLREITSAPRNLFLRARSHHNFSPYLSASDIW